ncbi:MAG: hypothetical protein LC808_23075 [Actinobacteria bacterium]|nr:hypothetical protein [Actinomycetota bacterium]
MVGVTSAILHRCVRWLRGRGDVSADDPAQSLKRAMALLDRFNDSGLVSDLDEAVAHGRAATAGLSVGGEEWAHASVLLSTLLHVRYRCIESLADLDEAISAAKVGVAAVPQDTPGIAGTLFTIGNMFAERYGHSRARADLDEAVTFGRHALAAARPDDPDREWVLFGLGLALASRQEISPDAGDLDQAVRVLDELMSLTPVDHPQRGLRHLRAGPVGTNRLGNTPKQDQHRSWPGNMHMKINLSRKLPLGTRSPPLRRNVPTGHGS